MKKLFFLLIYFLSISSSYAQNDSLSRDTFPSIQLLKIDLIAVNTNLPKKKLKKVERFFKNASTLIYTKNIKQINIDELDIPNIHEKDEFNFLHKKFIENYRLNNPGLESDFTAFIFKKNVLNIPFWVNSDLGVIFIDEENLEDNLIKSLGAIFGVHLQKNWVDSIFLENEQVLNKISTFKKKPIKSPHEFNRTFSTGLVNYCSWEENEYGSILWDEKNPMSAIKTHSKENTAIIYLDPSNWFFKPILNFFNIIFCPAHLLVIALTMISLILSFIKIGKLLKSRDLLSRTYKLILRIIAFIVFVLVTGFSFYLVDSYYQRHYVDETELNEIDGDLCAEQVLNTIHKDLNFKNDSVQKFQTQVLKRRENSWYIQREDPILVFRINHVNQMKFHRSTSSYSVSNKTTLNANYNHYYVFEKINENDEIESIQYFSTLNPIEIKDFNIKKTKNRILLFVNGYRASYRTQDEVSRSGLIKLISENKLEKPNSKNKIFTSNIFEPWAPWHSVDSKFIYKIQPKLVLYADGHHSIKTSNYNVSKLPFYINYFNKMSNLGYFGFVSTTYPDRCKDLNNHTCNYVNIPNIGRKKTSILLPKKSNENGFLLRKMNGRIAGKNLLQLLNNENHNSTNDTLFIVCHSMGFAYAEGIIDELRNKINFGGMYIIAPENPQSGSINPNEWNEVWHYGCDEGIENCLQDGIAPQGPIKGLEHKRIFFPKEIYPELGFSSSHYLSRFKWIFDLKSYEKGYISNH